MPCKNSPRKSVYCGDMYKPTNAQIIAELNYARCVFQLATICAIMGMTPPERRQHLQEQSNDK